jgi:hypothetical protein
MFETDDDRLPVSGQPGNNERPRAANIHAHNWSAAKFGDATDQRCASENLNVCTHLFQFIYMAKAVLEYRFGDHTRTDRSRQESHDRRLQVGGESWIGPCLKINAD